METHEQVITIIASVKGKKFAQQTVTTMMAVYGHKWEKADLQYMYNTIYTSFVQGYIEGYSHSKTEKDNGKT